MKGVNSMHVEFVEFVGAGIALWTSGVDDEAPAEAYIQGTNLVRRLAMVAGAEPVERLVDRLVRDLWQEWKQSKRSRAVLSTHLAALPGIMNTYRLPAGQFMSGLIAARKAMRSGGNSDLIAHRLASDIILKARSVGAIENAGLDESLCFFLLARMIGSLLAQSDALSELRPALEVCCGRNPRTSTTEPSNDKSSDLTASAGETNAEQQAPIRPAPRADVVRVANAWMIPVAALDAAVTADPACRANATPDLVTLESKAALVAELQSLLQVAASTYTKEPIAAAIALTREQLERGQLSASESAIGDAASAISPDADNAFLTAARVIRSKLAELVGDLNSAARHLAGAAARVATSDRLQRCQLLLMQAALLVEEGSRSGREQPLIAATQIYAEAGGALSEEANPIEWAATNVALGNLLLLLGNREHRPERFLAAALHFKPAVDVYSRLQSISEWARAQYGLARALKGTGEFQGDVLTLEDAAFRFRAALGVMTRDRAPDEWADAQLGLGETLVRIAEETGDGQPLREAVLALKSALAYADAVTSKLDVTTGKGALGRAYVAMAAHEQDETLLQDAIALLEIVLSTSSRALSAAEAAGFEQVRGTALWALGERRSSVRLLEDAARAKLNALDHFVEAKNVIAASRLREDLEDLAEAIDQLTAPFPRATFTRDAANAS